MRMCCHVSMLAAQRFGDESIDDSVANIEISTDGNAVIMHR